MSMSTKVLPCKCKSEYQDKRYGVGLRVHNSTVKPTPGWRCTVCKDKKGESGK